MGQIGEEIKIYFYSFMVEMYLRHSGDVEELVGYKDLCLGERRYSEEYGVTDRAKRTFQQEERSLLCGMWLVV